MRLTQYLQIVFFVLRPVKTHARRGIDFMMFIAFGNYAIKSKILIGPTLGATIAERGH